MPLWLQRCPQHPPTPHSHWHHLQTLQPWSQQKHSSENTRDDSTHGRHQMFNTKIRLIIFFAAKDGEALYSQQQ